MPSIAARRSESIVVCGKRRGPRRSRARARGARPRPTTSVTSPQSSASAASISGPVRIMSERPAQADDPRQPLGAAVDQRDAPAPLGEAEAGVLGRDPQVAPERQLEAAGQAPAGDRRDRRLRRRQAGEPIGPSGRCRARRRSLARRDARGRRRGRLRPLGDRLQVGAGAERLRPSPVSTSTRASSSASKRRKPSSSSAAVSASTALRRSRPGDRQHRRGADAARSSPWARGGPYRRGRAGTADAGRE